MRNIAFALAVSLLGILVFGQAGGQAVVVPPPAIVPGGPHPQNIVNLSDRVQFSSAPNEVLTIFHVPGNAWLVVTDINVNDDFRFCDLRERLGGQMTSKLRFSAASMITAATNGLIYEGLFYRPTTGLTFRPGSQLVLAEVGGNFNDSVSYTMSGYLVSAR